MLVISLGVATAPGGWAEAKQPREGVLLQSQSSAYKLWFTTETVVGAFRWHSSLELSTSQEASLSECPVRSLTGQTSFGDAINHCQSHGSESYYSWNLTLDNSFRENVLSQSNFEIIYIIFPKAVYMTIADRTYSHGRLQWMEENAIIMNVHFFSFSLSLFFFHQVRENALVGL